MKIRKTSTHTGIPHTRDIPVTQEQLDRWQNGELIQNVMPNISADDREFMLTGITPEEWDEFFGQEGKGSEFTVQNK